MDPASIVHLLSDLPSGGTDEVVSVLLSAPGLRVERIVSTGQTSPPGFHYDQPHTEWVAVLAGSADLRFADEPEPRRLTAGDAVMIAPHRRHRVEWTESPTVWLAIHYGPDVGRSDEGSEVLSQQTARG